MKILANDGISALGKSILEAAGHIVITDKVEQSFATVKSDRVYLLSTDTNEYKIPVDFTKMIHFLSGPTNV